MTGLSVCAVLVRHQGFYTVIHSLSDTVSLHHSCNKPDYGCKKIHRRQILPALLDVCAAVLVLNALHHFCPQGYERPDRD